MNPWEEIDDEVPPRTNLRVKKSIVDLLRRGGKWEFHYGSCKIMITEIIESDGVPIELIDYRNEDYYLTFDATHWTFIEDELEEIQEGDK